MRVVHVSRGFEDYVIELAAALAPAVELRVVLPARDEWMAEHLPANVDIIRSGAPPVRSARNALTTARLAKTLRSLRPDILHLQSGLVWEQALLATSSATRILTIHDVTQHPSRSIFRGTPQWLLDVPVRMADGIIVHGECVRTAAQARFGTRTPVSVVDHPAIRRYGAGQASTKPGRNVLFFGTMDEYKGLEYLAQAVPMIRRGMPDARFVIAGGSVQAEYYRTLFAGADVDLRIRRQSDAELQALFRWADALVMPYVEASQSGVLHLAISFGLPIVASDVGSLFDIVTHGRSAWKVPPRDPPAIAEAIIRVLGDEALRTTLIGGICSLRELRLNPARIAADTVSCYESARQQDTGRR